MSATLCIGIDASADSHAQWALFNADGSLHGQIHRGPLSEAAGLSTDHRTVVISKIFAATRTTTDLPVRGKKLAQALPFALEEQFAGDVEGLHFAAGSADDNGVRQVVALDHAVVAACIERLDAAQIQFSALHTIHDALPPLEHFTQILAIEDSALLLDDGGVPVGMDAIGIRELIDAWQATRATAEGDDDSAVNEAAHTLRLYLDADAAEQQATVVEALAQQSPPADIKHLDHGWFAFSARTVMLRDGINLLQGAFAARTDAMAVFRPWMVAAGLLVTVAVAATASWLLDYRQLGRQSAQLDADIAQVVTDLRGSLSSTRTAEQQLAQIVNSGRNKPSQSSTAGAAVIADFLPTLDTFSAAIGKLPETQIDGIAYRNGVFDIQLTAPNADALETLTKSVREDGDLSAKIQRTEQRDDGVKSFVQIQAAAR